MKGDSSDKRVPSFIQFTDTNSSRQPLKRRSARLANVAERSTKKRKTRSNTPSSSRQHRIPLKENNNDSRNDRQHQMSPIKDNDNPVTARNACDILDDNNHMGNNAEESAKENDYTGNDDKDDTVADTNLNQKSHPVLSQSPNRNDDEPPIPLDDHSVYDKQNLVITTTTSSSSSSAPHQTLEFKTITISPNHGHQTIIPRPSSPSPSWLTTFPPTSPLITNNGSSSSKLEMPVVYYSPIRTDLYFDQDTPSPSISDDDYYSAEDDGDWDV